MFREVTIVYSCEVWERKLNKNAFCRLLCFVLELSCRFEAVSSDFSECRFHCFPPYIPLIQTVPVVNGSTFTGIFESREASRGIPKFSEISQREFMFHSTVSRAISGVWSFSKIQQFLDFLESFLEHFRTVCHRFESFGCLESAPGEV